MKRFMSIDAVGIYVAVLAVMLSQLPPLYQFFEKADPIVSADGWMTLSHSLGRPNIELPITISNDGSAVLNVENIACTLTHTGTGESWEMSVIGYMDRSSLRPGSPANELPFGRQRIASGATWAETVRCLQLPSSEQFHFHQSISFRYREFFDDLARRMPNNRELVVFPEDIWFAAKQQFERDFDLTSGIYNIRIDVSGIEGQVAEHVTSDFQIDDQEMQRLLRHVEDYKFGFGIVWPSNPTLGVNELLD